MQDILSIDFGKAFTKIVLIKAQRGGSFRLLAYSLLKNNPAKNLDDVESFISAFIKEHNISQKQIRITISDAEAFIIKYLSLPSVPRDEMQQALRWQLKNELSFQVEEAVLEWQVARIFTDEDGAKKEEIMCALLKRGLIKKYLDFLSRLGLAVERLSVSPFNYASILKCSQGQEKIAAILDIGFAESCLGIYRDKILGFSRNLGFSSERLTQMITGTLMTDKGKLELSYSDAQLIKHNFGIPEDENVVLKDNLKFIHLVSLMRPYLEGVLRELKRSFDYYAAMTKGAGPAVLYLCGGGGQLKNLDEYLSKELNMEVKLLALPACLEVSGDLAGRFQEEWATYASCVGVALAHEKEANLLPQEERSRGFELLEKLSLRMIAVALAAVFLFLFFVANFRADDYRKRLKNAQLYRQNVEGIRVFKEAIETRQGLMNKVREGKIPAHGFLKTISAAVPDTVFLKRMVFDQEKHIAVLEGNILVAEASAEDVLSNFIQNLEKYPFFKEVTLVNSQKNNSVQEFQIQAELAG